MKCSPLLATLVTDALRMQEDAGFRVESFSLLPAGGWLVPDSRRSDHARFWDAGMPAVLITDTANGRSPHYHRRTDTVETLDLPFLEAAVRGLELAVVSIAERAGGRAPGR